MDEYLQVRPGHESWGDDVTKIAVLLDTRGKAFFTLAAVGSQYRILALDQRELRQAIHGLGPVGIGTTEGVPGALEPADEYTLWVVDSHQKGSEWLRRGDLHEPGYLASHLPYRSSMPNHVDVTAIAYAINSVEQVRRQLAGGTWGEGTIAELERKITVAEPDDEGLATRAEELAKEGGS